jgi:hypothetical protein
MQKQHTPGSLSLSLEKMASSKKVERQTKTLRGIYARGIIERRDKRKESEITSTSTKNRPWACISSLLPDRALRLSPWAHISAAGLKLRSPRRGCHDLDPPRLAPGCRLHLRWEMFAREPMVPMVAARWRSPRTEFVRLEHTNLHHRQRAERMPLLQAVVVASPACRL